MLNGLEEEVEEQLIVFQLVETVEPVEVEVVQ